MLHAQQSAPDFFLPNQSNQAVSLASYRGDKNVVLYFYSQDDTSGCTLEAQQFTALVDEFDREDTVVIGISRDSCDSHQHFIDKYGLKVELLSDEEGKLSELYGVWQEKESRGEKKMGMVRSTFVINKEGKLVDVEYGVDPDGHARHILDVVSHMH